MTLKTSISTALLGPRLLTEAINGRRDDIRLHDVNIFNFQHVIAQVGQDPEFQEFKTDLVKRSKDEDHEKRKSEMLLVALIEQRNAVPWWRRWRA